MDDLDYFLPTATDTYGFWIGLSDGSTWKRFLTFQLPKQLPEPASDKPVTLYEMDEGENHAGYRVLDTRKIDDSYDDFEILLNGMSPADMDYIKTLYRGESQVLASWVSGYNWLCSFQKGGYTPLNYPLNLRQFGRATVKLHVRGATSNTFA